MKMFLSWKVNTHLNYVARLRRVVSIQKIDVAIKAYADQIVSVPEAAQLKESH